MQEQTNTQTNGIRAFECFALQQIFQRLIWGPISLNSLFTAIYGRRKNIRTGWWNI